MTPLTEAEQRTRGKHREQWRSMTLLESRSHAYLHVTGQPCYNHASPLAAHSRQEVRGQEFHGRVRLMVIFTHDHNYHCPSLPQIPSNNAYFPTSLPVPLFSQFVLRYDSLADPLLTPMCAPIKHLSFETSEKRPSFQA